MLLGLLLEEPLEVAFEHDTHPRKDIHHQDFMEVRVFQHIYNFVFDIGRV